MGEFVLYDGRKVVNVHEPEDCAGEYCVIHNPSDHAYRDLPLTMNQQGVMIRISKDPTTLIVDPDSANFFGIHILRNSAYCLNCETHIQSLSVHDFRECSCGEVFVDGGLDYIRHGWTDPLTYQNTSIG